MLRLIFENECFCCALRNLHEVSVKHREARVSLSLSLSLPPTPRYLCPLPYPSLSISLIILYWMNHRVFCYGTLQQQEQQGSANHPKSFNSNTKDFPLERKESLVTRTFSVFSANTHRHSCHVRLQYLTTPEPVVCGNTHLDWPCSPARVLVL